MGLFDVFCCESGLVLAGDTRLILVAEAAQGRFEPVALPLCGFYNRCGGIDIDDPGGEHPRLLHRFCRSLTFDHPGSTNSLEDGLAGLSRGASENSWGRREGRKVSYALVDDAIYRGIAETVAESREPGWSSYAKGVLERWPFEKLFAAAGPARPIYDPMTPARRGWMRPLLLEMVRFLAWGTVLMPVDVEEGGQFNGYSEERSGEGAAAPYVGKAREMYRTFPRILQAVNRNENHWRSMDGE